MNTSLKHGDACCLRPQNNGWPMVLYMAESYLQPVQTYDPEQGLDSIGPAIPASRMLLSPG